MEQRQCAGERKPCAGTRGCRPSIATPRIRARAWLAGALWACLAGTVSAQSTDPPRLPPLTTEADSPRLPGRFVWVDLVTDDVAAARKFYARLFGWTFEELGGYSIAMNEGRPVAGMFQRERPDDRSAKPRWFGYISVDDVERAQKRVTEAGGKVLAAPQRMPERGEQAVFADPEGALFGVVRSSSGDPGDYLADVGDWIWIQLLSRDAQKASAFYCAVAGYEVVENTRAELQSDFVLASGGYARATVRTLPATDSSVRPLWLPFVRVKSVTASVARAEQLGGRVWIAPRPDLLDGRVAVLGDPTGAAIGVLEWSREELEGGN